MSDPFDAKPFDHTATPLRIGRVRLRVRDLGTVAGFYREVIGLSEWARGPEGVVLGSAEAPLVELQHAPDARPQDPRDAGLFHIAFLLPDRAALGRWLAHAGARGVRLQGTSDHIVSEALYLADPEGNGIEIYTDRPASRWRDARGAIRMATAPLDLPDLLAAGTGAWAGFPAAGRVGHVHLQVGDTAAADRFHAGILGLEITARYPGASFYGSGGYHHHLAGNAWNSRRAGSRPDGAAGLELVELVARDPAIREAIMARAERAGIPSEVSHQPAVLRDPWGTRIALAT